MHVMVNKKADLRLFDCNFYPTSAQQVPVKKRRSNSYSKKNKVYSQ